MDRRPCRTFGAGYLIRTEDLTPSGLLLLSLIGAVALFALASIEWPFGSLAVLIATKCYAEVQRDGVWPSPAPGTRWHWIRCGHAPIAGSARRTRLTLRLQRFDYFLLAYIFLNFLTSAVTSPEPRLTLRWAMMNAIVIAPYFLIRLLIKSEDVFHKAFDIMLWIGVVESAYGIICFLSNHLFETQFGMEINAYGIIPATYGTQYEPNLFGSYSACCAIMFLTLFLLGERSRWHGSAFLITLLGAAISLSRAVILAFPVVAVVVLWIAFKRGRFKLRRVVPLAAAVALLLLIFSPFLLSLLRERFSTIGVTDIASDETTAGRLVQMAVAVQDVQAHPLLGTGTASFQLLFNWLDYQGEDLGGWVGNTPPPHPARYWSNRADGISVVCGFARLDGSQDNSKLFPRLGIAIIALEAGLLLYAITFQSSEASLLAFTWVHFGLLSSGVAIDRPRNAHS